MSYEIQITQRKKRRWPLVLIVVVLMAFVGGLAYLVIDRGFLGFHQSPVTSHQSLLYHCPMHPTYTSDKPGTCPICGMTLVPVEEKKSEAATMGEHDGHFKEPPGRAALEVTPTQRQMIGVKTAIVETKNVTKEIRTVGTVAYDPKLAVAQREYLTARRLGDRQLTRAAEERLILMGMSKEQVLGIAKSGRIQKNLYLISPEGTAWVYGVIYEVDIPYISVGDPVEVTVPTMPDKRFEGTISAMDPIVDPMTRSIVVRSEVSDPEGLLKPNLYVNVHAAKPLGELMVVPRSSLLWSDKARYVFVDKGKGKLVPREVTVGKGTDEYVQVTSGLMEGERVVVNPDFLIDAESQLKATIQKMMGKGMKEDQGHGGHVH